MWDISGNQGCWGRYKGSQKSIGVTKQRGKHTWLRGGTRDGKGKRGTVGTGGPKEAEPRAVRSREGTGNPPPPPSLTVQPHGELPPLPIVLHLDGAALFQEAERRRVRHGRAGLGRAVRRRGAPAAAAAATGPAPEPRGRRGGSGRAGAAGARGLHRRAAAGNQLCATCPRTSQWPRRRFVLVPPPGS